MKFLARKVTIFFINKGKIDKGDFEVYQYCFEMLFSTIFNFFILFIGAIITKMYYETFIFTISFIVIRRCIGGYHSKTHYGCLSLLVIMYVMLIIMLGFNYRMISILSIVTSILCLIIVSIFAPVDHPNNPIDIEKKVKMNILAVLVVSIYSLLCIFSFIFIPNLNVPIIIAIPLLFSTISMMVGYFNYKSAFYDK